MYRKVAWLGAVQDLIDVRRCPPILFSIDESVGHETARSDEYAAVVDRRQAMARRELDDQIAIDNSRAVRKDCEATVGHAGDCDNRALDICGVIFYVGGDHFDAKRRRSGLVSVTQIVVVGSSFWIS